MFEKLRFASNNFNELNNFKNIMLKWLYRLLEMNFSYWELFEQNFSIVILKLRVSFSLILTYNMFHYL